MKRRPSVNEIEAAERFIEKCGGSKRAAIRAIDAATTRSEGGRPKGSPYLEADARVLFVTESLQTEYRARHETEPARRKLIGEAVDCTDTFFGSSVRLGANRRAVIERVASRPNLAAVLFEMIQQHRPDLLQHLPHDAEDKLRAMKDDPTKVNFAAMLTGLLFLWGMVRRHPKRMARVARASKDPGVIEMVRFLSQLRLDSTEAPNPSEKLRDS
jgi:hypothetical protein